MTLGRPQGDAGSAVAAFEAHRARLFSLAYRMLGSATDAEDAVQEAYVRWERTDRAAVAAPGAWLAKIVTNLCLNELASARVRRERYVGQWLPEPVLTGTDTGAGPVGPGPGASPPGPLETAEQRDSVSLALLVLLERLTPPERAVFVLREAFGYPHREIAGVLEISEANSRQIYRRAKQAMHDGKQSAENSNPAHNGTPAHSAKRAHHGERTAPDAKRAVPESGLRMPGGGQVLPAGERTAPDDRQTPSDDRQVPSESEHTAPGDRQTPPAGRQVSSFSEHTAPGGRQARGGDRRAPHGGGGASGGTERESGPGAGGDGRVRRQWAGLVESFVAAAREGDLARLERLLADDVVSYADGGGRINTARRPVLGPDRVARYLAGGLGRFAAGVDLVPREVNGGPGLVGLVDGRLLGVVALDVTGGRVSALWICVNPDKLEYAGRQLSAVTSADAVRFSG